MSIDVGGVAATEYSSMYTGSAGVRQPKQDMDSETFMTLLVAQLKYQDPSSPMNTNEMMAQTAQLASMEQLTKLSTTMSESFALQMRTTAADLVGKDVSYLDTDGNLLTGTVDAVRFIGEVPTVMVGDREITLDAVAQVIAKPNNQDSGDAPDADAPTTTDGATAA